MDIQDRCKMIENWDKMEEYGIQVLTGEACGLGMRLLCDLDHDGKAILEEFFGGCLKFNEGSNWNSWVRGKPAVASVMLPMEYLPQLAAFCMLKAGYDVTATGALHFDVRVPAIGFMTSGSSLEEVMKQHYINRGPDFRTYHVSGTRGTRNQHAMSGRVS